jgi:molybdate/tungstate transport system substrate-binding protein
MQMIQFRALRMAIARVRAGIVATSARRAGIAAMSVVAVLGTLAPATVAAAQAARSTGTVRVLYAGSLEALMNGSIAPAFQRATGYTLSGFPAGSKDLAAEIKGRVKQGDVFISASPKVDATLQGRRNGGWLSWYAPFATTRLVLGYNPSSSFTAALRSKPWFQVITQPGFRLGFTDPTLDPKGALTVAALDAAAARYHDPALGSIATDQNDLFPEQDLVGRLQSGQLDAGFFYTVEASAAGIPTVSLGSIDETATYTVTVLNRAPDTAGAVSFVKFLLSRPGLRLMRKAGLITQTPVAKGGGVPYLLNAVIKR